MSQTSRALMYLGNSIQRGYQLAGSREAQRAEFGLQRAGLEHEMARQTKADARQEEIDRLLSSGRKLAFQQNQMELDRINRPVEAPGFQPVNTPAGTAQAAKEGWMDPARPVAAGEVFGGVDAAGMAIYTKPGQPKEDALIYKFADLFGAKPNFVTGQFVKSDGTLVTQGEVEANGEAVRALFDIHTDIHKGYATQYEKLVKAKKANKDMTEEQFLKSVAILNSPANRMGDLLAQRERVVEYGRKGFPEKVVREKIEKIDKDIAGLRTQMGEAAAKQAERQFQINLAEQKNRWAVEAARVKAAADQSLERLKQQKEKDTKLPKLDVDKLWASRTDKLGNPNMNDETAKTAVYGYLQRATTPDEQQAIVGAIPVMQRRVAELEAAGTTSEGIPVTPIVIRETVDAMVKEALLAPQRNPGGFDPEGAGYDQATADAIGMARDKTGHMGSVAPVSPEKAVELGLPDGSYVMLKGKNHETWDKAVKAEKARGAKVIKAKDGRYYSVPAGKKPYPGKSGKKPFPKITTPSLERIGPKEVETIASKPRNINEAIYGRQEIGKSVIDWASQTQTGSTPRFGEGPIEQTLRVMGNKSSIGQRQVIAKALRKKYPKATDEQIAQAILAGQREQEKIEMPIP